MVIIHISADLKSVFERIGGMCFKAETILNLCMDGFMKNKVNLLDEANKVSQTARDEGNELRNLLSKKAAESDANKELLKSLLSIVSSIEMAITGLDSNQERGAHEICC